MTNKKISELKQQLAKIKKEETEEQEIKKLNQKIKQAEFDKTITGKATNIFKKLIKNL